jgi:hypothetical protein
MFEDTVSPTRAVQRVGDFFEQRKAFRLAALLSLRRREGLSSPVDEQGRSLETRIDDSGYVGYYGADGKQVSRVLFAGAGRDGKPGSFAVGQRKGANIGDAEQHWGAPVSEEFEILAVAEDGRKLEDELLDLNRDSATYERAERVSYGHESEQAPDLQLRDCSDAEVEARLQEYLKQGPA